MKVVNAKPPNYDEIVAVFPNALKRGVIFTYGDTIYVPSGVGVSPQLQRHEEVHSAQQKTLGVENWWGGYLKYSGFRYEQELAAHIAEYEAWQGYGRVQRRVALKQISGRLASKLYGSMVTKAQAKEAILATK